MQLHTLKHLLILGVTDDEGSLRGSTFFSDPAGVNEFQEKFETLGKLENYLLSSRWTYHT